MSNPIKHLEPDVPYFALAFPRPQFPSQVISQKKEVEFLDPNTGKTYKAVMQDMLWYPEYFISDFYAKLLLQKTAEEVREEMVRKYKLRRGEQIAIVQFKKL